MSELVSVLTIVFAAALGSGFYSLATAQRYIRTRTFDPQLNQVYVIRFVVGIVAGTIFASLLMLDEQGTFDKVGIGPSIAAIIGGYAAEVVQQILSRLADAMLTIVKGSPADQKDLAMAQAKVESESKNAVEKVKTAKLLSDIKNEVSSITPGDVTSKKAALDKLSKAIDGI